MEQKQDVLRSFRAALIVCGAMMFSLLVYVAAAEVLRASLKPFYGLVPVDNPNGLRYIFYAVAALQVVVIRLLRPVLLRRSPDESASSLAAKQLRTSILTAALSEVPAILGFVLFLLAGLNRDFYVLTFVSLALMFMFFPRRSQWEAWVAEAGKE